MVVIDTDRGMFMKGIQERIIMKGKDMVMVIDILLVTITKAMNVREGSMIVEDETDLAVYLRKDTEGVLHLFQAVKRTSTVLESKGNGEKEEMIVVEATTREGVLRDLLLQVQIHLQIDVLEISWYGWLMVVLYLSGVMVGPWLLLF